MVAFASMEAMAWALLALLVLTMIFVAWLALLLVWPH